MPASTWVEEGDAEAIVGLGSNLRPEANLSRAVELLRKASEVAAVSSAWATAAVGPPGQPPFVNAAVLLRTRLPPGRLKAALLRPLEAELGRVRTGDRFAPRTIDLDLVAYTARPGPARIAPLDPDLLRHAHVALPASEVAPDWVHPGTGETLAELAARVVAALPPDQRPRRLPLALAG